MLLQRWTRVLGRCMSSPINSLGRHCRRRQSSQQNHWHVKHKEIVNGMGTSLKGEHTVGHRVSDKASPVSSKFLGSPDMEDVDDGKFVGKSMHSERDDTLKTKPASLNEEQLRSHMEAALGLQFQ
jgi:Uri superfamily endonuclease